MVISEIFSMPTPSAIVPPTFLDFNKARFVSRVLKHSIMHGPNILNERRAPFELMELLASDQYLLGTGVPRASGDVKTILPIAGFLGDDRSLQWLKYFFTGEALPGFLGDHMKAMQSLLTSESLPSFIKDNNGMKLLKHLLIEGEKEREGLGYNIVDAKIFNVHPASELMPPLERLIKETTDRTGTKVILVGDSLGGTLGLISLRRFPEEVFGVYGLAAVFNSSIGVTPTILVPGVPIAAYHAAKGIKRHLHVMREEFNRFEELNHPFVNNEIIRSLFTKTDGILTYMSCLRRDSQNYEIEGASHAGMMFNLRALMTLATLIHEDTKSMESELILKRSVRSEKSEGRREKVRLAAA